MRASGRSPVFDCSQRDDDVFADTGLIEVGHGAPLHETIRQMIGEILDPGKLELFQRTREARPDALEVCALGKQGIETFGAHDAAIAPSAAPMKLLAARYGH